MATDGNAIGIVVAMREERKHLLGNRKPEVKRRGRFPVYTFGSCIGPVFIVETGMGLRNAADGTQALLKEVKPQIIVSAGYGGGVTNGLLPGQIVVAEQIFRYRAGMFSEARCRLLPLPFASAAHVGGTVITTDGVEPKKEILGRLPQGLKNVVVEMETWGVAGVAALAGIPLVAVRGISDGAGEEVELPLGKVTTGKGQVSVAKVLLETLKNPSLLPHLLRLARSSAAAGRNLSLWLDKFLQG